MILGTQVFFKELQNGEPIITLMRVATIAQERFIGDSDWSLKG